jgi:acyl-coenzyme A synthetase/AMP-(fatty) acid ligase
MEKEICDWLATRVIHYKQLRGGVVFVEKVPKTASGKVKSHFDWVNGRY